MRIHLVVYALVLSFVDVASAQGRADFSGTWILAASNPAASDVGDRLIVRESFVYESVRGTPRPSPMTTIAIDRYLARGIRADSYQIGIIGGFVTNQVRIRVATRWDDGRLVIETSALGRPEDAGSLSEHREVWTLDARDSLSIVVTDRRAAGDPTTATLVYRRQQ